MGPLLGSKRVGSLDRSEQFVNETLSSLARVELLETADKDHNLPAFGKGFFNEFAAFAASWVVIYANKAQAVAVDQRLSRALSDGCWPPLR